MDRDASPRVLAVLVANDGQDWLPEVLDSVEGQTYRDVDILAVDNGSRDGSRELLIDRLGHERVLVAERDLGYAAAVSMALDAAAGRGADYLFLLHDDSAPEHDTLELLVQHLERFPEVAVAGPKKVHWDDPSRLQSVGWSIDLTGRAESGIEVDELDQGQRDQVGQVLAVSTSGMLVRASVFEELGRFDRRYHLFRDDLDLCWRAWLAGHEVETVPAARVRHVASASNYRRLGQTALLGPRYFSERNTLATLLKNYQGTRLVLVTPLFFVVGVLKVLGFVATRRFGDAWQTLRAWAWNVVHLPETWRFRRQVQEQRRRSDAELSHLFVRIMPRVRAYAEAVVDWVTGGDYELDERTVRERSREARTGLPGLVDTIRRHPTASSAAVLAVVALVLSVPILSPGNLRGGELAPWPLDGGRFLSDYVSSWHNAGAVGTEMAPSPAQAVLAIIDLVALGNAWLAPRLLILGALPLAWVLALRATRIVSDRRLPRIAAATAYVLSPPAVAALVTGRIGALVVTVCLPALAIAYHAMLRPGDPSTGWRATAAATLIGALGVAFEPILVLGLGIWLVIALAALPGAQRSPEERRGAVVRLVSSGVGTLLVLFPWSLTLLSADGPLRSSVAESAVSAPFWRWLLLSPPAPGFPGVLAGGGFLAAGLIGLAFAFRRHALGVASLWAVALGGIYAGWVFGGSAEFPGWFGLPLLASAGAFAGLLALAFATAAPTLEVHDFGWRQVAAGITSVAVALGLMVSGLALAADPWSAYAVAEETLPSFVESEREDLGPFRVMMLADVDGTIEWDVTSPQGPSMTSYGVPVPASFAQDVNDTVTAMVGDADPGAAGRLAVMNVRYLVVPAGADSERLAGALAGQLDLEPQPVAEGSVYRVRGWLPRASWVSSAGVASIATRGELPPEADIARLRTASGPTYVGEVPASGAVVLAEPHAEGWEAIVDGEVLRSEQLADLVRFPVAEPADRIVVRHGQQTTRTALVVVQLAFVLLVFSLVLRPPGFVRPRREQGTEAHPVAGPRPDTPTPVTTGAPR